MELVERYSLFSFWNGDRDCSRASWSEASSYFGEQLLPISQMLRSVHEDLSEASAVRVLDLVDWRFCAALELPGERRVHIPVDWFKKLNEFNGSSAGNTLEESVLQGACELVERHVSAIVDTNRPVLPTLDPASFEDPALCRLHRCFADAGIKLWLKDFTLDMGIPTVGALAYDPGSFPHFSEIVFTAGTAASPAKAAIRALTEVAQLAGDFETCSGYEASGLSKYRCIEEAEWIHRGPLAPLSSLPDISSHDLLQETVRVSERLHERGYRLYSVDVTHPDLQIPCTYTAVPGFRFRERSPQASLGLFVGRILAEERPPGEAASGLRELSAVYPQAPFLPFYWGLLRLRTGDPGAAAEDFARAEDVQPNNPDRALAAFYLGYARTCQDRWQDAIAPLDRAVQLAPDMHAPYNLRGAARFRGGNYERAAADFQKALDIDRGSAPDLANLGVCYRYLGKREAAVDFLRSSLELEPGLDYARRHLQELCGEDAGHCGRTRDTDSSGQG
jgi:ribosomal protein S12 methylthiotransferase accessory factor